MKDIYVLGLVIMLSGAVAFTGLPQQKEKKEKQEQPHAKGNKEKHADKGPGKQPPGQAKKDNAGNGNDGKNNPGENKGFSDKVKEKFNGKNNDDFANARNRDGWNWDRETFKERKKYRNGEKVTICHKFNNNEPAVTLNVSVNALKAHMDHGDAEGRCPEINDDRYSDEYIRERNEYYERIQRSREQVLYSRSILDYALQRLTDSKAQLVTMRNNNVPAAEIERKEAVVLQLQEDVSLLETLIGVTAGLIANKLQ